MEHIVDVIKAEFLEALRGQTDIITEKEYEWAKQNIVVDLCRNPLHGDFFTNIILLFDLEEKEREELISNILKIIQRRYFAQVVVVKPGFINFFLKQEVLSDIVIDINNQKQNYGFFQKKKLLYNLEFVSANPTGLLHIGHARNAAYGDLLSNIWEAYGIVVNREYYVNDGGNQIDNLTISVLARYLQSFDIKAEIPEDGYHANEIIDCANLLKTHFGEMFKDLYINNGKIIGSKKQQNIIKDFSKQYMLDKIKNTLNIFGVNFNIWSFESDVYKFGLIESTIKQLKQNIYVKESATWLKTTLQGDDKDRVLIKSDGTNTYFLPDIAYHNVKFSRGYDQLFNIWGSDHASYANRMKIAMSLLGYDKEKLHVLIMQMVRLVKGGEEFKMSKRTGNSLTLQDLLDTIGKDCARWYLVSQSISSHLEIDVDKATTKDNNNPLFYVQYARARIHQVINNANVSVATTRLVSLTLPSERILLNMLHSYKLQIESIAKNYEVHRLCNYLVQLARHFHNYYANNRIIDENNHPLTIERVSLCQAIMQVIDNGLSLMKITPLNKM